MGDDARQALLREIEEYLIVKIADLLHVPKSDFLGAKIEAKEAFFAGDA